MNEFIVEPDEEVTAIHTLTHENSTGTFVIGTMRNQIGEHEPSSGRLVLFDHDMGRDMKKIAEVETNGCVYAITSVGSTIAAAVNTSVSVPSS